MTEQAQPQTFSFTLTTVPTSPIGPEGRHRFFVVKNSSLTVTESFYMNRNDGVRHAWDRIGIDIKGMGIFYPRQSALLVPANYEVTIVHPGPTQNPPIAQQFFTIASVSTI